VTRGGLLGRVERLLVNRLLQPVYRREIEQLGAVASGRAKNEGIALQCCKRSRDERDMVFRSGRDPTVHFVIGVHTQCLVPWIEDLLPTGD